MPAITSEHLAALVAEYLRSGGKITVVPAGVSALPEGWGTLVYSSEFEGDCAICGAITCQA